MGKKVLFLNDAYNPAPSPNGICISMVMRQLISTGYKVFLLTLKNKASLASQENIDGVDVIRVENSVLVRALYYTQTCHNAIPKKIICYLLKLKGAALGLFWPLLSITTVFRYYQKARKLHKHEQFAVIISVYKQIEAVLAAILLKKRQPDIKMIVYLLDAISGSQVPRILRSRSIAVRSTRKWEKIIFENADAIFIMEAHKYYYLSEKYTQYQHKIHILDIPLLDIERFTNGVSANRTVRILFTGSMTTQTADPTYFLKILENMGNTNFIFTIYGSISDDIMNVLESSPLFQKQVFFKGRTTHNEIMELQKKADILLNLGNDNPCMIPCKIFEYISTGNKIVSIVHSDSDSSIPYMKKYPNALIISEKENLNTNVDKLIYFLQQISNETSKKELAHAYKKNMPEFFVEEMENLIERSEEYAEQ